MSRQDTEAQLRVLLVDDDDSCRTMATRWLTAAGHDVHNEASPFSVAQALNDFRPDVAVLDFYMPALNGVRVAEYLRAHASGIGIVVYTAAQLGEARQEFGAITDVHFVSKGSPLSDLSAAVAAAAAATPREAPAAVSDVVPKAVVTPSGGFPHLNRRLAMPDGGDYER